MENNNNLETQEQKMSPFLNRIHLVGRIGSLLVMLSFVGAGLIICSYFQYSIDFLSLLLATLPLFLMMFFGSTLSEFLAYLPQLGPGATYIAYITGNITNMKLPSIMGTLKALDVDVDMDSDEFHILSIISACTASLLVIVLLGVVVLFSGVLTPILSSDLISPAIDYIMPALYPVMLASILRRNPIALLVTAAFAVTGYLLVGSYGALIGGMGAAIIFSVIMYEVKSRKAAQK
ncbi:MAG: hypothetical protein LUE16_11655 [Lachnospiraceae bacterium]|nr:hypothetical protein [Lachnospiraceae bacterium]